MLVLRMLGVAATLAGLMCHRTMLVRRLVIHRRHVLSHFSLPAGGLVTHLMSMTRRRARIVSRFIHMVMLQF